jgi:hypothetical protein
MKATGVLKRAVAAAIFFLPFSGSTAMDYRIDVARSISWERQELTISTAFDLASAGLKMPAGRSQAEVFADMEFPRLAQPTLFALPVDSSTTVESMVRSGALTPADISAIASSATRSASVLSGDLRTLTTTYRVDMRALAAGLVKHHQAAQSPKTMMTRPTRPYTGIVVYADEELPVHGTKGSSLASPCFFPKIWDTEMNLIYERNMTDPGIARSSGIAGYGASQDPSAYSARVGKNPLRILARGLFGILPTDPVIDRDDALKILSSEENKALLRDGKVVIVLNDRSLGTLR